MWPACQYEDQGGRGLVGRDSYQYYGFGHNYQASLPTVKLRSVQLLYNITLEYSRDPAAWALVGSLMSDKANESVWRLIKVAFDKVLHLVISTRQNQCIQSLFQGYSNQGG